MKKMIFAYLVFCTTYAFGHITDSDSADQLDIGSTIELTSDLNVTRGNFRAFVLGKDATSELSVLRTNGWVSLPANYQDVTDPSSDWTQPTTTCVFSVYKNTSQGVGLPYGKDVSISSKKPLVLIKNLPNLQMNGLVQQEFVQMQSARWEIMPPAFGFLAIESGNPTLTEFPKFWLTNYIKKKYLRGTTYLLQTPKGDYVVLSLTKFKNFEVSSPTLGEAKECLKGIALIDPAVPSAVH